MLGVKICDSCKRNQNDKSPSTAKMLTVESLRNSPVLKNCYFKRDCHFISRFTRKRAVGLQIETLNQYKI